MRRDKALGYQQITGLSAATGLTVPSGTQYAIVQTESQNVRWRDDGTDPTASVGMVLIASGEMTISANLSIIKFIEVSPSAKLNVSYYS